MEAKEDLEDGVTALEVVTGYTRMGKRGQLKDENETAVKASSRNSFEVREGRGETSGLGRKDWKLLMAMD